jgi:hypothetical protein
MYFPFGMQRGISVRRGIRIPNNSAETEVRRAQRVALKCRVEARFELESLILAQNERWRRA